MPFPVSTVEPALDDIHFILRKSHLNEPLGAITLHKIEKYAIRLFVRYAEIAFVGLANHEIG